MSSASDPPDGAPPESPRAVSAERVLVELRFELDHALRQLEVRAKEARESSDEAERATLHALKTDVELQGVRRLLSRLKERVGKLLTEAQGTPFETELHDIHTILDIHAPPGDDDETF